MRPAVTPTSPIQPHTRHLLSRLQREWTRLSCSADAVAAARRWPIDADGFDSLDDLLRLAGYGRVVRGSHDDDHLLAQLVLVARHDQLAARVVLQRLLPGIASLARRYERRDAEARANPDEVVAAAWVVIRGFPVERRSQYVAANLLRAIEYEAFTRERRRPVRWQPVPDEQLDRAVSGDPPADPAGELRELLEDAIRAGLDPSDVELARLLGRGATTAAIAVARSVTDRTVRNHRTAMVHRLRQVALAV